MELSVCIIAIPPKCRRVEGIIDGGGPRCPHYLPNSDEKTKEKQRKSQDDDAKHCLYNFVNPIGIYLLSLHGLNLHKGQRTPMIIMLPYPLGG